MTRTNLSSLALRCCQALILALVALLFNAVLPSEGFAQTVHQYTNSTDTSNNGLNEDTAPCWNPLERTFYVSQNFVVDDVDIGVLLEHTYRGDLRMYLRSPSGTQIELTDGSGNGADDYNVRFDDSAWSSISNYSSSVNVSQYTSVPPYAASYRPDDALNAFNGEDSAGTWTFEICDQYNRDSGTFRQTDLFLTEAVTPDYADLSLSMSLNASTPVLGQLVTYTMAVANASGSPQAANSVTVHAPLPSGLLLSVASGDGSYNPSTGIWTIGTLDPGESAALQVIALVNASSGATVSFPAEIASSSVGDSDSTPGNGSASEDDYDAESFTVGGSRVAGTPPSLPCPAGTTVFDWSTRSWSAGTTNNSYTLTGLGTISFTMSNPGQWLNNNSYGGQSPARQSAVHGATNDWSVVQLVNLGSRDDVVTTTIDLPAAMPGAQFTIFDVDYGSNQFADRVVVEGRLDGAVVLPTLTNGVVNYVVGNAAYGDGVADNDEDYGNVVVTFTQPIDTIIIRYGDHDQAPSDPGQQAIALHDITFCNPGTAIEVSKTSTVISDPVSGTDDPKAIPGAIMQYCILVENSGGATASAVVASDTLPDGLTYVPGSLTSGSTCENATQAEDDNASGSDESDPFGVSFSAGTVVAIAASLPAGNSFAFGLQAVVD